MSTSKSENYDLKGVLDKMDAYIKTRTNSGTRDNFSLKLQDLRKELANLSLSFNLSSNKMLQDSGLQNSSNTDTKVEEIVRKFNYIVSFDTYVSKLEENNISFKQESSEDKKSYLDYYLPNIDSDIEKAGIQIRNGLFAPFPLEKLEKWAMTMTNNVNLWVNRNIVELHSGESTITEMNTSNQITLGQKLEKPLGTSATPIVGSSIPGLTSEGSALKYSVYTDPFAKIPENAFSNPDQSNTNKENIEPTTPNPDPTIETIIPFSNSNPAGPSTVPVLPRVVASTSPVPSSVPLAATSLTSAPPVTSSAPSPIPPASSSTDSDKLKLKIRQLEDILVGYTREFTEETKKKLTEFKTELGASGLDAVALEGIRIKIDGISTDIHDPKNQYFNSKIAKLAAIRGSSDVTQLEQFFNSRVNENYKKMMGIIESENAALYELEKQNKQGTPEYKKHQATRARAVQDIELIQSEFEHILGDLTPDELRVRERLSEVNMIVDSRSGFQFKRLNRADLDTELTPNPSASTALPTHYIRGALSGGTGESYVVPMGLQSNEVLVMTKEVKALDTTGVKIMIVDDPKNRTVTYQKSSPKPLNEGDEAKNIMRTARQLLSDIKTPVDKNDNLELIITSDTDEGVKRLHSAVNFIIATDPKKYEGLRVVPYNSKGQELIIHNSSIMWFIHKVIDVLTTFSLTSTARTVADTRLKKENPTRTARAEVAALRHGQQTLDELEKHKADFTTNPRPPGPSTSH